MVFTIVLDLCGHMVTAVTVTTFAVKTNCGKKKHGGLQGDRLGFAGRKTRVCRERNGSFPPFPYAQTIIRLYANDCVPIRELKRQNSSYFSIDMLLAARCFKQFQIVALGPLVQLFAGGVERQS